MDLVIKGMSISEFRWMFIEKSMREQLIQSFRWMFHEKVDEKLVDFNVQIDILWVRSMKRQLNLSLQSEFCHSDTMIPVVAALQSMIIATTVFAGVQEVAILLAVLAASSIEVTTGSLPFRFRMSDRPLSPLDVS